MPQDPKRVARRDIIKYGGVIGIGTSLAGCSGQQGETGDGDGDGDGNGTPTQADGADDGDDGATSVAPEPFVYVTSQTPASVDPARSLDELEGIYNQNVYDPLLRYGQTFPPEVVPSVAVDWTVGSDGRTYTFDIRDDIVFHNGDQLTAEDVVFSVDRMMTIQAGPSWLWDGVMAPDAASALDDTTVEITLNQTYAPFIATLPWLFIVNKDEVLEHESDGDLGGDWLEDNDAGSGPYRLDQYNRGESIDLLRHENWWGDFAVRPFKEAVFDIGLEISTAVGMMKNGEAHLTDRWLPTEIYNDLDASPGVRTQETTTFNTYFVFLHTQRPPLDDVHVRRAISWAFDYETAIDILGAGAPFRSPLPEGIKYHTTEGVPQYEKNLDRAEAELEESQYDLEDIEFSYAFQPAIQANADMGLMMQDELGDVGITVNLEEMTWSRMVEVSSSIETAPDSFPLWGLIEYADPDAYMWGHYHSSQVNSFLNGGKYVKEEVDNLLVEGRRTIDDDARREIYVELQQTVANDAPTIFVANDKTRYSLSEKVDGFRDNGIMGYTHQLQKLNFVG